MSYLGSQPNNLKQNIGLYTPSEILQLTKDGSWGGSLELIQEETISSSYADFTNLGNYDVHLFQFKNVVPSSQTNIGMRFSNDGGSSYTASGYQYAWQRGYSTGGTLEVKSTSRSRILINGDIGTGTNDSLNGYVYCYNLSNSSKYSFCTFHTIGTQITSSIYSIYSFGGGVLPTAETHNAVRFGTLDFAVLGSGSIKLFGVKQI